MVAMEKTRSAVEAFLPEPGELSDDGVAQLSQLRTLLLDAAEVLAPLAGLSGPCSVPPDPPSAGGVERAELAESSPGAWCRSSASRSRRC
jgi:hypothetical protein